MWRQESGRYFPLPPEELASRIGGGDFIQVGSHLVDLIASTVGIRRGEKILDLGCGLGRIVPHIRPRLGWLGRYLGIDIVPEYVEWCRKNLERRERRFRFERLDVANGDYLPAGAVPASRVRLPVSAGSFSLVIATSLFTHLLPESAENYVQNIARALKPGGRLFATFFLLDESVRRRMEFGQTDLRFDVELDGARVQFADNPERAVAFDSAWAKAVFDRNGLDLMAPIDAGLWSGAPNGKTYQDLVLLTKRR